MTKRVALPGAAADCPALMGLPAFRAGKPSRAPTFEPPAGDWGAGAVFAPGALVAGAFAAGGDWAIAWQGGFSFVRAEFPSLGCKAALLSRAAEAKPKANDTRHNIVLLLRAL